MLRSLREANPSQGPTHQMTAPAPYPIGTPGKAWGSAEKSAWLSRQIRHRSYADDVLARIELLRARFDVTQYGLLEYGDERFPLLAVRSRDWRDELPCVLV